MAELQESVDIGDIKEIKKIILNLKDKPIITITNLLKNNNINNEDKIKIIKLLCFQGLYNLGKPIETDINEINIFLKRYEISKTKDEECIYNDTDLRHKEINDNINEYLLEIKDLQNKILSNNIEIEKIPIEKIKIDGIEIDFKEIIQLK